MTKNYKFVFITRPSPKPDRIKQYLSRSDWFEYLYGKYNCATGPTFRKNNPFPEWVWIEYFFY